MTASDGTLPEETTDECDRVACPWCGKRLASDLSDLAHEDYEQTEIECGGCGKVSVLQCRVSVSYTARAKVTP